MCCNHYIGKSYVERLFTCTSKCSTLIEGQKLKKYTKNVIKKKIIQNKNNNKKKED